MANIPEKILIVGLGLIGGSLAAALKKAGCPQVIGWDRNRLTVEKAQKNNCVDIADTALSRLPTVHTEMICIAVPPRQMPTVLKTLKRFIVSGIPTIDTCSVKVEVTEQLKQVFKHIPPSFVPCHPIAGSHQQGIEGADSRLFIGSRVALTPLSQTRLDIIEKVRSLWNILGCETLLLSPEEHDQALALSSHLPHVAAATLMSIFADLPDDQALKLSRKGLSDTTRIAMSNPGLWRDICLENKTALLKALDEYQDRLSIFIRHIRDGNGKKLKAQFSRARKIRLELNEKNMYSHLKISPGGKIIGTLTPPGDKSISHRALLLGALAQGETVIRGFLRSEDCLATMSALRNLNVEIHWPELGDKIRIQGSGGNFAAPDKALDLGNSGTGVRLLSGLLASSEFSVRLDGDESLRQRPMQRIIDPLQKMGVRFSASKKNTLPMELCGSRQLHAIDYTMPVASAQVKSAVLLAALQAAGTTVIREPTPCRDHTERMLRSFGCQLQQQQDRIIIHGGSSLLGTTIEVPGDISSAMFAVTAACIASDSELLIRDVGINPTRTGGLEILQMMGADIEISNRREWGYEPVADIRVKGSQSLQGIEIPRHLVPSAIDEFPVIFIAAACAHGKTVLAGAEELRVKESDRIAVMAEGLGKMGVECHTAADGIMIKGGFAPDDGSILSLDAAGDHRVAMSFSIAALRLQRPVIIRNTHNVATSWPGFPAAMQSLGLAIQS